MHFDAVTCRAVKHAPCELCCGAGTYITQHISTSVVTKRIMNGTMLWVQDGKTEYKSVTVSDNATAREFMDFYLDDPSRHTWVCRAKSLECKCMTRLYCHVLVHMHLHAVLVHIHAAYPEL